MSAAADRHWAGLLRAALLGTGRQPPPDAAADGSALSRALAAAAGATPEDTLLAQAAVLAAYRRATRAPARDERPPPAPAEEETAPLCPPGARRHLATMLGGTFAQALPEWLAAAARAGFVIPPDLLPALLQAAFNDSSLRPHLAALVGAHGRWLAAQRQEWAFAIAGGERESGEAEERDGWEVLSPAARPALLARVRARSPARGRALLESTWAKEAPRERAALLAALEPGLSLDDEPFLEAALDDRRKDVRAAAAQLLSRLSGSRLVARMAERARGWLAVSPGRAGLLARVTGGAAPVVEVRLPEACDAAMERDGIVAKPPHGLGERAWWLLQAVAAVPPQTWSRAAGAEPAELLAAAARGEWRDVLIPAWSAAAVRHADAAWAQALLAGPPREPWTVPGVDNSAGGLLDLLPADRAEAVALAAVAGRDVAAAVGLLGSVRRPWSAELTRAVLGRIAPLNPGGDWAMRQLLASLAPRMHPAAALDAVAAHPQAFTGAWVALLHHRHAMLEALKR
jgi:hypothetical protein